MVAGSARRRRVNARGATRRARNSTLMSALGRAGLAARGVMYILIGVIAVQIAFSSTKQKAESTGAVRLVAANPFGSVLLWLLAIGFAGLTLWRLSEAIWGSSEPDGHKATKRLGAAVRAIIYGFLTFSILKYALGLGAPSNSNKQSQDLTAKALQLPGGQVLVAIVGIVIAAVGLYIAYQAWKKKFLRQMRMGSASATTRKTVERLGQVGGIARGAVFATAGIFLVVAAVNANPGQAKGVDSALRALARTPLGPWLLVLVALGLVTFGVFSLCQARWQDV